VGRDGSATPSPDFGRVRRVGGNAGIATNMAVIRDGSAAFGAGPQRKSGRLSCWALKHPSCSGTTRRLDFARLHDRLRIAMAA
jgi:hypothetical protein